MVDDELQNASHRHRHMDLATLTHAVPVRPVAQRAAVAGQGVLGFTFAQQFVHVTLGDVAELGRQQGRYFLK